MADKVAVEQLADDMYTVIEEYAGKRKFKAQDLVKEMITKYGQDRVTTDDGKKAIRQLIDSGRCIYTYFGGSFRDTTQIARGQSSKNRGKQDDNRFEKASEADWYPCQV
jgi:hypothetical protein